MERRSTAPTRLPVDLPASTRRRTQGWGIVPLDAAVAAIAGPLTDDPDLASELRVMIETYLQAA